ncbi:MAG: Fe-S-containing protein, partial [Varibaculum cambriense]|nr:Fe-S-containing protein [Varibaculum cambriense]
GYYEDGGKVICRRCGVMMNIQTIGFPGGCNPIPIKYEVGPKELRFFADELSGHAKIFKSKII